MKTLKLLFPLFLGMCVAVSCDSANNNMDDNDGTDGAEYRSPDTGETDDHMGHGTSENWQNERNDLQIKLERLEDKIDDMIDEAERDLKDLRGDMKKEKDEEIADMKEKREEIRADLNRLKNNTKEEWNETKRDVQETIDDVEREWKD